MRRFAKADVQVINAPCTSIDQLAAASVDAVFMSNFLEHLPDKAAVLATLRECWRILRPLVYELQSDPAVATIDDQAMVGPWLMTAPPFISEPVAGKVSTVPKGTTFSTTSGVICAKPNLSRSVASPL